MDNNKPMVAGKPEEFQHYEQAVQIKAVNHEFFQFIFELEYDMSKWFGHSTDGCIAATSSTTLLICEWNQQALPLVCIIHTMDRKFCIIKEVKLVKIHQKTIDAFRTHLSRSKIRNDQLLSISLAMPDPYQPFHGAIPQSGPTRFYDLAEREKAIVNKHQAMVSYCNYLQNLYVSFLLFSAFM